MTTRAQSHKLGKETILAAYPKLSAMERGLLTWAMLEPGDKVLDAHVHSSLMLEYMARNTECEICGISGDMEGVRQARARLASADIVYARSEDIPWREHSFDAVFWNHARQGEPNPGASFREIFRVLKPGGQFLLGVECCLPPLRQILRLLRGEESDPQACPLRCRKAWLKALSDAGYHEVMWRRTGLAGGIAMGWKPIDI